MVFRHVVGRASGRVRLRLPQGPRRLSAALAPAEVKVDRAVGYWLLGCSGMVAGMVSVGGMTRLTKSGLSMTEWNLTGRKPPMSKIEWDAEFERYKTFPEWQQRKSMTLDEFKYIFWWEYGHRQLGRCVGVAFGVPLAYFLARGRIPAALKGRMFGLFALGGAQGLIGAWMVQSGLDASPEQRKEIRVSPYRLATHLGMAFTTYSLLLWTAMDVLRPRQVLEQALEKAAAGRRAAQSLGGDASKAAEVTQGLAKGLARVRGGAVATLGLVFTTALSGAFVAGNDAGRAFNTFPDMDGQWVPSGVLELEPLWRNFFENTACVQFDHRCLALASTTAVGLTLASGGASWAVLPPHAKAALVGMGGMVCVQASLGVGTLLLYVPIELAAAHQLGSLVLLSVTALAAHSLKPVPGLRAAPLIAAGAGALSAPGLALLATHK